MTCNRDNVPETAKSVMSNIHEARRNLEETCCHPEKAMVRILTNRMIGQIDVLESAIFEICCARLEEGFGKDSAEYAEFTGAFWKEHKLDRGNRLLTDKWLLESAIVFVDDARSDLLSLRRESRVDSLVFDPVVESFGRLRLGLESLMSIASSEEESAPSWSF